MEIFEKASAMTHKLYPAEAASPRIESLASVRINPTAQPVAASLPLGESSTRTEAC
jgi:hypothetical protein